MDFELQHRIRFEYELEQMSNSFKQQMKDREFNVQMSASSTKEEETYVINFSLVNEVSVSLIQFDLTLPSGISIDTENFIFLERMPQAKANITIINNLARIMITPENPNSVIPGNDDIFKIVFSENNLNNLINKTIMISNINITGLNPSQYSNDNISVKM